MPDNDKIILQCWPRWLSLDQTAAYCCFSARQVRRMIKEGLLSVHRINMNGAVGQVRIDRFQVDKLFEKNEFNYFENEKRILNNLKQFEKENKHE